MSDLTADLQALNCVAEGTACSCGAGDAIVRILEDEITPAAPERRYKLPV